MADVTRAPLPLTREAAQAVLARIDYLRAQALAEYPGDANMQAAIVLASITGTLAHYADPGEKIPT